MLRILFAINSRATLNVQSLRLTTNSFKIQEKQPIIQEFCTAISKNHAKKEIQKKANDNNLTEKSVADEILFWNTQSRCSLDPKSISASHMENILTLETKSSRLKYYQYLSTVERIKEKKRIRKNIKAEKSESNGVLATIGDSTQNKMFLLMSNQAIAQYQNIKLIQAIQFGQKLVIDCSYDEKMTLKETMSTAQQLTRVFGHNRLSFDPFDLYFCNMNPTGTLLKHLRKCIPTVLDKKFPLHIREDSYLNHFPKEKLVYLTPHSDTDLLRFSPNDVYVIGAMTDKANHESFSLEKANNHGIRTARLPLDRFLEWKSKASKCLTIDQVLRILLELKCSGDWRKALLHVPHRKIVKFL